MVSRSKAAPKKGRRASDPHQQEIDAIMAARQQAIDLPDPEPYLPETLALTLTLTLTRPPTNPHTPPEPEPNPKPDAKAWP